MNLKVLMLGLLIGCANFSAEAYPGSTYVNSALDCIKNKYTYVTTGQNWQDHPVYFGLGTTAVVAVAGAASYLTYKKYKNRKAKTAVQG